MTTTDSYRSRLQNTKKATRYANRFTQGPRRRIDQREQRAVRKIFSALPDVKTVLDVPCGAGRFLKTLSQGGREVMEMDVATEILEFGRQQAAEAGIQAVFRPGDAAHLPLENDSVDVVFCNRLLHHITAANERAVFLREFHRVARRYLVISFFDYLAFGGLRRFLKKLKGRTVNYDGQPTLKQFCAEVAAAGFKVIRIVPTGPIWVAEKYFVLKKI